MGKRCTGMVRTRKASGGVSEVGAAHRMQRPLWECQEQNLPKASSCSPGSEMQGSFPHSQRCASTSSLHPPPNPPSARQAWAPLLDLTWSRPQHAESWERAAPHRAGAQPLDRDRRGAAVEGCAGGRRCDAHGGQLPCLGPLGLMYAGCTPPPGWPLAAKE